MAYANLDRAKAIRVHRIMKEAVYGPVFTRPLSRPKGISWSDPYMETLIENRQFIRKKYRINPKSQEQTLQDRHTNRRGLLGTKQCAKRPGGSNYLSILKQKLQVEDAQEGAKLELTMSRPASAALCYGKKDTPQQYAVSIAVPSDLSRSMTIPKIPNNQKSLVRKSSPIKCSISKLLENEVTCCNCVADCVCGKATLKALVKHMPESTCESIDDIIDECREAKRDTSKLRTVSVKWLRGAISQQKLQNKKFLKDLKSKLLWTEA